MNPLFIIIFILASIIILRPLLKETFAGSAPLGIASMPVDRIAPIQPSVPTWPSIQCGQTPINQTHFFPNIDSTNIMTNPSLPAPPIAPHQLVLPAISNQMMMPPSSSQAGFMPQQNVMIDNAAKAALNQRL
jgi:hypothetical protein